MALIIDIRAINACLSTKSFPEKVNFAAADVFGGIIDEDGKKTMFKFTFLQFAFLNELSLSVANSVKNLLETMYFSKWLNWLINKVTFLHEMKK